MTRITFFTKEGCKLCEPAWFVLKKLQSRYDFTLERIDIADPQNQESFNLYCHDIPVVHVNGQEFCKHRVNERALREHLESIG